MRIEAFIDMINDNLPVGAQAVVHQENDESFMLAILDAVIRDGEIVNPKRRWLVEATITVPVSFIVEAVGELEVEENADTILTDVTMDIESDVDMARPDGTEDFGAGMVRHEIDSVSEE